MAVACESLALHLRVLWISASKSRAAIARSRPTGICLLPHPHLSPCAICCQNRQIFSSDPSHCRFHDTIGHCLPLVKWHGQTCLLGRLPLHSEESEPWLLRF